MVDINIGSEVMETWLRESSRGRGGSEVRERWRRAVGEGMSRGGSIND